MTKNRTKSLTIKKAAIVLAATLVFSFLAGCATPSSPDTPSETPTPKDTASDLSDRKPKRIESEIIIDMGELYFADAQGAKGGTFRVPAGKVVGIHVLNTGQVEHEIIFGRAVAEKDGAPDGYNESLFEKVDADLFVFRPQKMEIETEGGLAEVELEPGADVWIRVTFPEDVKGTWEIGCFVVGHYEGGMKATLVIE